MDEHDDQVKARIFNRIFNTGPCSKDFLDCLAKKALASGNDRLLTEVSRRKADSAELEAELEKIILARGDIETYVARWNKLKFRIYTWQRLFPSKKQRSS